MDILPELLIIAALILLNGVFVAAEIALVTVRRSRLQQLMDEGSQGARRVDRLVAKPGRFLAVVQLAITFIGFLAAAVAGANTAKAVEAALEPVLGSAAGWVSLLVVTLGVALVTAIFGELVPKALGLAHAERYALLFARPVEVLGRVFAPVVWLLERVTGAITGALGVSVTERDRISSEELRILVERGGEQGVIEAEEEQMIGAVLGLGEHTVHEVMVPRIDIVGLPVGTALDQMVDTIVQGGHSRIPVYEETIDNIVGILYAKDLLPYLKGTDQLPPIRRLARAPLFVPESMSVDDLLHQLQRRRVHIAVVLDEYGGTAGLVEIEDLLEEIVGEIVDEFDTDEEPMIVPEGDDRARVDGRASVDDLLEHFDLPTSTLEDQDEYDTVGGLIYHRIGGIPHAGDVVTVGADLTLTVESTDGRRVDKVLAISTRPVEESEPEPGI
jgi:magnesium and cobalt exporter, CNNM family